MALESATFVDDLVTTNPPGSDPQKQGDDHIRLLKAVLKNTFPGLSKAIIFGTWAEKDSTTRAISTSESQSADDDGKWVKYDCSGGARTFSLLPASTAGDGFFQIVDRTDSSDNLLTIAPAGAEQIDQADELVLGPRESAVIVCDGSAWHAVHSIDALPGTVKLSAAARTEPGWLFCNGQALSRVTYKRLFETITRRLQATRTNGSTSLTVPNTAFYSIGTHISGPGIPSGTTVASIQSSTLITMSKAATSSGTDETVFAPFGVGDGSTTFNVPDFRSRVPIGRGAIVGLTNRPIGDAPGSESENLSHNHSVPVGYHKHEVPSRLVTNAVQNVSSGWPHGHTGITRNTRVVFDDGGSSGLTANSGPPREDENSVSSNNLGTVSKVQPSLSVYMKIKI